jgi:DnaJ domain
MVQESAYRSGIHATECNWATGATLTRLEHHPRRFGTATGWAIPLPMLNLPPLAVFTLSFLGGLAVLGLAASFLVLPLDLQPVRGVSLLNIGLALMAAVICAFGVILLVRAVFGQDSQDGLLDFEAGPGRADTRLEHRRNHLLVLGLTEDASQEEIRDAFRNLVRRCHPDLHPNDPRASVVFRKAMAARDALLAGQG